MISTILLQDAVDIIYSAHKAPGRILGMHKISILGKKALAVRAYLPDASTVEVIETKNIDNVYIMNKIHRSGLFETIIKNRGDKPFKYKFKIKDFQGKTHLVNDAYAFWQESLSDFDKYLFNRANHYKIYEKLGAHPSKVESSQGVQFAVWAPNAVRVSVVGNFNNWDGRKNQMTFHQESGIWELFVPDVKCGDFYKFEIKTKDLRVILKSDPYAFSGELPPTAASIVFDITKYKWKDSEWMKNREHSALHKKSVSIYSLYLPAFMLDENHKYLNYRELAEKIVKYVKNNNFSHIELFPIAEHKNEFSFGFEPTSFFSPTCRLGNPYDFMYFIDYCHQNNIGVIMTLNLYDFPNEQAGLALFDGSCLYEKHNDKLSKSGNRRFDIARYETSNFLIGNALFWLDKYHIDGLRIKDVEKFIENDDSNIQLKREHPNAPSGNENMEGIEFIRHLNSVAYQYYPGIMMIADGADNWPSGITKPVYSGGIGFGYNWNNIFYETIFSVFAKEPSFRKNIYSNLVYSINIAKRENYILPLTTELLYDSHKSIISKMSGGDLNNKFANLRLLFAFMFGHPGKKLIFSGTEYGSNEELNPRAHTAASETFKNSLNAGVYKCFRDLGNIYFHESETLSNDYGINGFDWIISDDPDNCVMSFSRYAAQRNDYLIFVFNFGPAGKKKYNIGVPEKIKYLEIFNSDSERYGGFNEGNGGMVFAGANGSNGKPFSVSLTIPALSGIILKPAR